MINNNHLKWLRLFLIVKGAFTYSTDSTKVFISVDNSDKTKLNITWDTSPGSKTPYYTTLTASQAADGEYYSDYAECTLNIADFGLMSPERNVKDTAN
jgi:hypothetical protein